MQALCSSSVPRKSRPGPKAPQSVPHTRPYRSSSDFTKAGSMWDSCSTAISTESNPQALKFLKSLVLSLVKGEVNRKVLMPNLMTTPRRVEWVQMERLPTAAFQAPVKECDDTRKLERDKVENLGRCNALVTEGEETALVATTNLLLIRRGFVHTCGKAHGKRRWSRRKALAVTTKTAHPKRPPQLMH